MLNINDLLNRAEILYPTNTDLSDLRRSYTDKDLSSIFRVLERIHVDADLEDLRRAVMHDNIHAMFRLLHNQYSGAYDPLKLTMLDDPVLRSAFDIVINGLPAATDDFATDLKKACVDKNYYSFFRLLNTEKNNYLNLELPDGLKHDDFRKLVLTDNKWSAWRLISFFQHTFLSPWLRRLEIEEIEWDTDSISQGQLNSKIWLVDTLEQLNINLGTVYICAGWYGLLASLMFERNLQVEKIRSFDIDPSVIKIAEFANHDQFYDGWRFCAITKDILDIEYEVNQFDIVNTQGKTVTITDTVDTVVNTSCEHIRNFDTWYNKIPSGKIVVLQSNDYDDIEEHVNISRSLNDFAASTPMTTTLFEGELQTAKYTRFMRIGIK